MDSWFDRGRIPATRWELHYGGRIVRCFVARPKSVHEMLERAVTRRADGMAVICGDKRVTYTELNALVGEAAGGLKGQDFLVELRGLCAGRSARSNRCKSDAMKE